MTTEHRAGLIIRLMPTSDPTKDEIWIEDLGPTPLRTGQVLDLLRVSLSLAEQRVEKELEEEAAR